MMNRAVLVLSISCVLQSDPCSSVPAVVFANASVGETERPVLERNVEIARYRGRRFVGAGEPETPETWKTPPVGGDGACVAPGNRKGHCKPIDRCDDAMDVRSNALRFIDSMCIVASTHVGICCPDRTGTTPARSANRVTAAGQLPTVADEYSGKSEAEGPAGNEGEEASRSGRGCGMSTNSWTKVIGGRPADPREWPWMAALLRQNVIQYCGGVLITDRHVLTAAHCVVKYKPRDIKVRLGEYDFERADETRAIDLPVAEIRVHRDFEASNYENDIAIVRIERPTSFNSYVWPVCLPPVGRTFEKENAIVTGWGTRYYGGPASTVLMEVAVPIWPQEMCVRSFTQRIPVTTMCAGDYAGGRDACQGDSGGPLLHRLGNNRWVVVGIVSWGIRCGEPGHPGIYTRVNSYLDWIFANAMFS